jgi:photosystem II stability/assembly factor-like uncharacterized protein
MNLIAILLIPLLGFGPWESVGPEGGEVRAILQSTQDASILYALSGTYPSQVIRSTDNGSTWNTISEIENCYPYDMVMTQSGKLVVLGSSRTWTSSDGGLSWTSCYLANTIFIDGVAHPADGDQVFAAGYKYDGSSWNMSYYHTGDAGTSWNCTTLVASANTSYGRCIAISESNPDHILVGGYEYNSGYTPYLFRSTNGGVSFADVTPPAATYYIYGAAIHPVHSDTLLAGSLVNMFRSTDGGTTWTSNGSLTYNYDISFSEADNNLVFSCGTSRIYRSTNIGASWTSITSGLTGSGINWIEPDELNASIAYTGSSAGFFYSSDGGVSWTPQNSGLLVGKALAMEYVNGSLFMNMQDMGLFRAVDGPSITWQEVTTPLTCGDFCALEAVGPDTVLALEGTG